MLDAIQDSLSRRFSRRLLLWKVDRDELAAFGGELDAAVQMPGWTNVWTMPIQNRVDMLSTGVNTPIGIRVLGRNLDDVVRGSEEVARVVKAVHGAVDVVADPIRGKPYIEIRLDRERAAELGVSVGDINDVIETALAGKVVSTTVEGRERHPVVVRCGRALARRRGIDPEPPVTARGPCAGPGNAASSAQAVPAGAAGRGRQGPGRRGARDDQERERAPAKLCAAERRAAATPPIWSPRPGWRSPAKPGFPDGVFVEWTGQFEHTIRAAAR